MKSLVADVGPMLHLHEAVGLHLLPLIGEVARTDEHFSKQVNPAHGRMKEDNFLEYLVVEMNLGVPFRKGFAPRCVLRKVEPLNSKSDDLLQVTDLLTGCVNNRLGHPAGERKQQLRRKAEELGLISDQNIWVWKPKSEWP